MLGKQKIKIYKNGLGRIQKKTQNLTFYDLAWRNARTTSKCHNFTNLAGRDARKHKKKMSLKGC